MSKFFKRNRARVQDFLYNVNYIKPLRDSSYELIELKAKKNDEDLRKVTIHDIPFNDMYPTSWIIDLEINERALPFIGKKPEKALVFFTQNNVEIVLFELKSSLNIYGSKEADESGNLFFIYTKYRNGLEQILMKLPLFLLDNEEEVVSVNIRAITFYNQEFVTYALNRFSSYEDDDEVRFFIDKSKNPYIFDVIKSQYPTRLHWVQNPNFKVSPSEFEFSLYDIISPDYELDNAQFTGIKCPREKLK